MSIKAWFKNLNSPPTERYSLAEYHEREIASAQASSCDIREYVHKKLLPEAYLTDNKRLKRCLAQALTERKTVTRDDFDAQFSACSDAVMALAHQKLLGVSLESEISKIIIKNYREEVAKLSLLVFEDISELSEETVEERVKQYMEEHYDTVPNY